MVGLKGEECETKVVLGISDFYSDICTWNDGICSILWLYRWLNDNCNRAC